MISSRALAAAAIGTDDRLYVFGGQVFASSDFGSLGCAINSSQETPGSYTGGYYADFWVNDLSNNEWTVGLLLCWLCSRY